jgi:hypothetical protein
LDASLSSQRRVLEMIKRIAKGFWNLMVELGEARQKSIKEQNYSMWY